MAKFKRGNLDLLTNQKIRLGDSRESQIIFDGTDLTIQNDYILTLADGDFSIKDTSSGSLMIVSSSQLSLFNPNSNEEGFRIGNYNGELQVLVGSMVGDTYIEVSNQSNVVAISADSSQRFVTNNSGTRIRYDSNSIDVYSAYSGIHTSTGEMFRATNSSGTIMGVSGSSRIEVSSQGTLEISGYTGTDKTLSLTSDTQYFGRTDGARLTLDTTNAIWRLYADANNYTEQEGSAGPFLVVENSTDVLNLTDAVQRIGVSSDTYVTINQSQNRVSIFCDTDEMGDFASSGLELGGSGARINEFSTDGTLADNSDTAVPTEKAVRTYVDATLGGETYSGRVNIPQDTTSLVVVFDVSQVDENYSLITHIVNRVDWPPSIYAHMTTDYDKDGFTELFSGPIDSGNYYIHYIISRNDLSSSSSSSSSKSSSSSSASLVGLERAIDTGEARFTDDDQHRILE